MLIRLNDSHRELVHHLRNEAERWLASKGLDQYQRGPRAAQAHADIDRLFDRGKFVGWHVDGAVRAVVAVSDPDPDFWTVEEMAESQAYITRFLVAEHGRGYGRNLLEAVAEEQARKGVRWLRLDCWRTNTGLHEYYKECGFEHVRTEIVPGRLSGALFQRRPRPFAPTNASRPEPQPVVAAIVTSDQGVLIGKRNDGIPPWTFISGEIEPGESPIDAVVREVKEETGLRVEAAEYEIGRRVHPQTGRTMIYLACHPVGKTDIFVGDEEELAEVRWVNLDEVKELLPGLFDPVHRYLTLELA